VTDWVAVEPLTDTPEQAAYWQSWEIGDRVRYRFQGECPGVYGLVAPVGHPPEYDGMVGVVYDDSAHPSSHRYCVKLDEGSLTRAIQAAACELEPLP
jgi:hypothetical protein